MNITIPQTYEELNEQQRGALCSILLTTSPFGGEVTCAHYQNIDFTPT